MAVTWTISRLLEAYEARLLQALERHKARVSLRSESITDSPGRMQDRGVSLWVSSSTVVQGAGTYHNDVTDTLEVEVTYKLTSKSTSLREAYDFEDEVRRALTATWDGKPCAGIEHVDTARSREQGYLYSRITFAVSRLESLELLVDERMAEAS